LFQSSLNELWNETFHGGIPLDDYHLSLECWLTPPFDLNYNEYIRTFNKEINSRSHAFDYLRKGPLRALRTLIRSTKVKFLAYGTFIPKGGNKFSLLVSMDFNHKDLRSNPSQVGEVGIYGNFLNLVLRNENGPIYPKVT